jgi:hypothetical protein
MILTHPYAISRSRSWRKTVIFVQALERPHRWFKILNKFMYDESISPRLIDQAKACISAYKK